MKSGTRSVKADSKKGKTKAKNVKVEQKQSQTVMTTRSAQSKKGIKPVARRGRPPKSQNAKNVPAIPLRRSTRKTKVVSIVYPKQGGKGKKGRKKKKKSKRKSVKASKEAHFSMKRRTKAYYSYWLNGLRLSRKPDDERVMEFRREKLFVSAGDLNPVIGGPPKCHLCSEAGPTSGSTYIYCGDCKGNKFSLSPTTILNCLNLEACCQIPFFLKKNNFLYFLVLFYMALYNVKLCSNLAYLS